MHNKLVILGVTAALVLIVAVGTVLANPGEPAVVNGVVNSASLVRTNKGLSMTLHADGLTPGIAATVWWVIDNNPIDALPFDGVCNAAGHIVGESGYFNAGSHLALDEPSEDFCYEVVSLDNDGNPILGDGPALTNPAGATVILIVQDHGDASTGQNLVAQLNIPGAGCEDQCPNVGSAIFAP